MVVLTDLDYKRILHDIRCFEGLSRDCKIYLIDKHPQIPVYTLGSILATQWKERMKRRHWKNHQFGKQYYNLYKQMKSEKPQPGVILKISVDLCMPPSLLATSILHYYFETLGTRSEGVSTKSALKDSTLIQDSDLAYEIYLCSLYDDAYGTYGNVIRQSIGKEYEQRLEFELNKMNIPFIDENVLRNKGYDKTPDFKLVLPIAIDGFVINWIESKALFGDDATHAGYLKDQLLCYWNRFGPGLVIYWFGYLDVIEKSAENNTMIILRDCFPDEKSVTLMNPSVIDDL